jgi:hypothetical protein
MSHRHFFLLKPRVRFPSGPCELEAAVAPPGRDRQRPGEPGDATAAPSLGAQTFVPKKNLSRSSAWRNPNDVTQREHQNEKMKNGG